MTIRAKFRKKLVGLLVGSLKKEGLPQIFINPYDMLGRQVLEDGLHEYGYLQALLAWATEQVPELKKDGFIDVGANIGNHSLFFQHHFACGYAFEPMPLAYKVAEANFLLNNVKNTHLFNVGLDCEPRKLPFWQQDGNLGGSGFLAPQSPHAENETYSQIECTTVVADDFPPLIKRDRRIGLVKIDVEGFENNVLLGMRGLLDSDAPLVVFESHGDAGMSQIGLLQDFGYTEFFIVEKTVVLGVFNKYRVKKSNVLNRDQMYPMVIAKK